MGEMAEQALEDAERLRESGNQLGMCDDFCTCDQPKVGTPMKKCKCGHAKPAHNTKGCTNPKCSCKRARGEERW
jgi:hypothetical protein